MMKKFSLGALMLGVATAACGGGDDTVILTPDSSEVDALVLCNTNAQSGCDTGEKCTWITVTETATETLGVIGCAPDGDVALDGACTFGEPGQTTGFDNCAKGLYCNGGTCEDTCSLTDGSDPCEDGFACSRYNATYANSGEDPPTGICDPTCDPLTQKSMDDTETTFCGAPLDEDDNQQLGCFGVISGTAEATSFSCAGVANPERVHPFNLTEAMATPFINACAPRHLVIGFLDGVDSGDQKCLSLCMPGDIYEEELTNVNGVPGSGYSLPEMDPPILSATEHCSYIWRFEGPDTPLSDVSYGVGIAYDVSIYGTSDGTTFFPATNCTEISVTDDEDENDILDILQEGCANPENFPDLAGKEIRRPDRNYGQLNIDAATLQSTLKAFQAARK